MKVKDLPTAQRRLWHAIRALERAAIDHSWRGGGDPDDVPAIEARYQRAARRVFELLANTHMETLPR